MVTQLGWFYPRRRNGRPSTDRQGRRGTLHGTGITGRHHRTVPLVISALSGSITHVRSEEFSDIRTTVPSTVIRDWMLFVPPGEGQDQCHGEILGAGFRQSVRMVTDLLGFAVDGELRTNPRGRRGHGADRLADRSIEPGLVAGQRFAGRPPSAASRVTAAVKLVDGRGGPRPRWSFGPDGERFEVG